MGNQQKKWDDSYRNRDNFLFYPHEEIIRFVSKYIRKRVGLNELLEICSTKTPKLLDLGCGIGRHIIYASKMGIEAYGIDLSEFAIQKAIEWAEAEGVPKPKERIKQGDIRNLPWADGYFDFVVSHGVLDSMNFEIAKGAIKEVARVLKESGLFYCDLISGDDSFHAREYAGEEFVETQHEQGTVQSYFNFSKIKHLIKGYFEIEECVLIKRENVVSGGYGSRYHLVLRRK